MSLLILVLCASPLRAVCASDKFTQVFPNSTGSVMIRGEPYVLTWQRKIATPAAIVVRLESLDNPPKSTVIHQVSSAAASSVSLDGALLKAAVSSLPDGSNYVLRFSNPTIVGMQSQSSSLVLSEKPSHEFLTPKRTDQLQAGSSVLVSWLMKTGHFTQNNGLVSIGLQRWNEQTGHLQFVAWVVQNRPANQESQSLFQIPPLSAIGGPGKFVLRLDCKITAQVFPSEHTFTYTDISDVLMISKCAELSPKNECGFHRKRSCVCVCV